MTRLETTESRRTLDLPARRFSYPTQAAFLSQAALLEEVGPPKIPTLVCLLGSALVCVAIVTAALVEIDVVSSSTGRLISSKGSQGIQSYDGGIVAKVDVIEGQIVDVDDILVSLRDPEAEAQLNRLKARQVSLAGQARRLRSLTGIDSPTNSALRPKAILFENRQMAILPIEEAAVASERSLVRAEISRRMKNLIHLHALHDDGSAKLRLVNEKLAVQKTLHQKKLTPKSALVEAEQEAIEAKLSLAEIEGKIIETEATVLESRRRLEDVIASRRQRQADQLSSIMLELSELDTQVLAFRNRIERGTFKAPIRGVIQELNAKFPGQIIAPGERLLELIPANDDLIVEARLSTKEVRHVRTGQKVRITVDGIDPHRVGYLEGNVQHLSPSTFIDESGTPYYRLWIALTTNYLAGAHLIPGMTIQAQINTGQRTVFEYLFKPVYRAWDTAFRER